MMDAGTGKDRFHHSHCTQRGHRSDLPPAP